MISKAIADKGENIIMMEKLFRIAGRYLSELGFYFGKLTLILFWKSQYNKLNRSIIYYNFRVLIK